MTQAILIGLGVFVGIAGSLAVGTAVGYAVGWRDGRANLREHLLGDEGLDPSELPPPDFLEDFADAAEPLDPGREGIS